MRQHIKLRSGYPHSPSKSKCAPQWHKNTLHIHRHNLAQTPAWHRIVSPRNAKQRCRVCVCGTDMQLFCANTCSDSDRIFHPLQADMTSCAHSEGSWCHGWWPWASSWSPCCIGPIGPIIGPVVGTVIIMGGLHGLHGRLHLHRHCHGPRLNVLLDWCPLLLATRENPTENSTTADVQKATDAQHQKEPGPPRPTASISACRRGRGCRGGAGDQRQHEGNENVTVESRNHGTSPAVSGNTGKQCDLNHKWKRCYQFLCVWTNHVGFGMNQLKQIPRKSS